MGPLFSKQVWGLRGSILDSLRMDWTSYSKYPLLHPPLPPSLRMRVEDAIGLGVYFGIRDYENLKAEAVLSLQVKTLSCDLDHRTSDV